MSTLKRGRKRKGGFNNNNNAVDFDVDKFRMIISDTLALFPNSDVPKWLLTMEWVKFEKMYFSSSRPKEYYIRESVFPGLQQDKNKARPENYIVMATEFDIDLACRDVISANVITEVNQVDDVVMSSGEKRDTYGVSDDFSQLVSSRGSNVPNADSNKLFR